MKKNIYVLIMFILGLSIVQAKPVTPATAKNIATGFYQQHSTKSIEGLTLAYTETSTTGEALYYVFNVNANDGFVIVTADDAAHPIIGYSTKNQFVIPKQNNNISYWMTNRKKEIMAIKAANVQATADITREWNGNFSLNNNAFRNANNVNTVATASVAPLVQTTWDQEPYYNDLCPGTGANQAVTGCVATAMAQVMKFWSYPAQGRGSSSYCDCTAGGYTDQWGTLSANYGATTYSWSAMPLNVSSANLAVATLMYDCGVSVDMDYDVNGSGADALSVETGGGPCSQIAFVSYFKYDSTTIQGYQKANGYTDTTWIALIKIDLNAGRPVIYEGDDATQGGHCWVCDGYDATNLLHMNWGWSGQDDGYFTVTNLTTTGNFNPIMDQEVLVGIQPPQSLDAGVSSIVSPSGVLCASTFTPVVSLKNYGLDTLKTCNVNYQIDGGATQTYSWTGSLANGNTINVNFTTATVTAGSHTITGSTANPNNGTDSNSSNNQITGVFVCNTVGAALPLMEGFEGSTNLPSGWSLYNPDADAAWQVSNLAAYAGTNCIAFNNCDGDGNTDMTGKQDWFYTSTYDFSAAGASGGISFDVAYAPYNDGSQLYNDTLVSYYSLDCGTTWNQIYRKGGATLATAAAYAGSSCFLPASANWRTDFVLLPALAGQSNVMFAFENISDWGETIFLDNINILASGVGIASINHETEINLYPNPAHNSLFIAAENINTISVTDVIGQTVLSNVKVNPAQQTQSIDVSNLNSGVYFVKLTSSNNQTKVIRFIKE